MLPSGRRNRHPRLADGPAIEWARQADTRIAQTTRAEGSDPGFTDTYSTLPGGPGRFAQETPGLLATPQCHW